MKKMMLGNTGIEVSELCFGVLPIGPLQKNVPLDEASDVIAHALQNGVTYLDTAQMYKTYDMVRLAIEKTGTTPVISTKSVASTYADMEFAIKEALEQMNIKTIDIFFLHAARVGASLFEDRKEALRCLADYKAKGIIKAIGVSTHSVDLVEATAKRDDIDVIFPLLNRLGTGILRGSREDMEKAIRACEEAGKGVLLMKALAGGSLISSFEESFQYARDFSKGNMPIAVGMIHKDEVDMNIAYFEGEDVSAKVEELKKSGTKEFLASPNLCKACGKCIPACGSEAISMGESYAIINPNQCVRCGYCVPVCPEFAIRMI